jgi:hypothetical protein
MGKITAVVTSSVSCALCRGAASPDRAETFVVRAAGCAELNVILCLHEMLFFSYINLEK